MTDSHGPLQIGEVAHRAGTTIRTVRYYLELGLIEAAERSAGGFYLFEPHTADTVRFIKKMNDMGVSLNEIKALIETRRTKGTGEDAYRIVLASLEKNLDEVVKQLEAYQTLKDQLEATIDIVKQCEGCSRKPNRENCLACEVTEFGRQVPVPFGAIL